MGPSGGCLCGSVRYQLKAAPFDCGWCHCRTCQLSGGAPALAFATIAAGDFEWTEGEQQLRWIPSSSFGKRAFCDNCRTPLMMVVNHQPETVDFVAVTLDDPTTASPEYHIFWASKVAWFNPGDTLPRHDQFRPNTVGLEGTEPPA